MTENIVWDSGQTFDKRITFPPLTNSWTESSNLENVSRAFWLPSPGGLLSLTV